MSITTAAVIGNAMGSLANAGQGSFGAGYSAGSSYGANSARNYTNGADATIANMRSAYNRMQKQQQSWEDTAAYNSAEAAKLREWQEYMSNTAYQRAVRDMKLAGINPILAYTQGGAATGTGMAASMDAISGAQGNAIADSYGESSGYSYGSNYSQNYFDNNMRALANSTVGAMANILGGVTSEITEQAIRTGHRVDLGGLTSTAKNLVSKANGIMKSIANAGKYVANNKNKYNK